jgi:hypothetical protein
MTTYSLYAFGLGMVAFQPEYVIDRFFSFYFAFSHLEMI